MNRARDESNNIWLVRHGESTWNVRGLIQGQADGPVLTAQGHRQSAELVERFRSRRVEALYASDLVRAQQTAAYVGSLLALPVRCDAALRERCFGAYEGLPLQALEPEASGIVGMQIVDPSARPPGGESLTDVRRRVAGFVQRLAGQRHTGDVVVVTHGGTMRVVRAYCTGTPLRNAAWDPVPNGTVWPLHPPEPAVVVPHPPSARRVICVPQP
jgi:probable phosphoglycerate mutase